MRRAMLAAWMTLNLAASVALAQHTTIAAAEDAPPRRTHLILKDGSYQVVLSYKVSGNTVRYKSAERGGETEEIPLALVDMDATHKWERDHAPYADAHSDAQSNVPVLSPELQKEEADRAARTPEVAPNLKLPEEDSVLVLDTFQDVPEIVPMHQQGGDLNKETAHNMLRLALNPQAAAHQILLIPGESADVQLHVADPVFYIRIASKDDESTEASGSAFTVDTSGAQGRATPAGGSSRSSYVLLRVDVRVGTRAVESFHINMLGGVKPQADVIETRVVPLPGGHWLQLKPRAPLEFGEYALMEIVSDKEVNLGVWDFGVHPTAPENADAIRPELPHKPVLDRRKP